LVKEKKGQEQLQCILCLKNSLARSFNFRDAIRRRGSLVLQDSELKQRIKQFLLDFVTSPPNDLLFSIFSQALDIIGVFVALDFPSEWPEL